MTIVSTYLKNIEKALATGNAIEHSYRPALKELILNHLRKNEKGIIKEFQDVFPDLRRSDIHNMLQELKRADYIIYMGTKKSGYRTLRDANKLENS